MRIITIVLLVCSVTVSKAQVGVGKPYSAYDLRDSVFMFLTSQSHFDYAHLLYDKGIKYQAVVNKDSIITYISTSDSNFTSPEGLRVGMQYSNISKKVMVSEPDISLGWFKTVKLTSNWYAMFAYDKPLTDSSKIIGFYQKQNTGILN